MTAPVPDPREDIDWSEHRGSCRIFYAERRCTCGAVPDPRFRDQLALWLLERYPDSYEDDSRSERRDADALLLLIAAEEEARVQAAANQRAAVEVETATREHFGRAYAPPGGPIDGITKLAQASFRAGYVIARAAALASPAPAPPCWCIACEHLTVRARTEAGDPLAMFARRFIVCPDCGNKRCPKATHHNLACTGSNEPGQPGSAYAQTVPPPASVEELQARILAQPAPGGES